MPLKAVLFDFDGVIAETENHHIAAWQRTLSVLGWQVPDELAARSAEVDDREFLSDLFAQRGFPADKVSDWVGRKQVLTVQLLRNSPRLYPGVGDLVQRLRGKVRLAIVSGAALSIGILIKLLSVAAGVPILMLILGRIWQSRRLSRSERPAMLMPILAAVIAALAVA